jgi:hypothetical protein
MRRLILMFTLVAMMAAVMVASAMTALADDPQLPAHDPQAEQQSPIYLYVPDDLLPCLDPPQHGGGWGGCRWE